MNPIRITFFFKSTRFSLFQIKTINFYKKIRAQTKIFQTDYQPLTNFLKIFTYQHGRLKDFLYIFAMSN